MLPDTGLYCAVGIKQGQVKHKFSNSIEAVESESQDFNKAGFDSYFACASFSSEERKQEQVNRVRSLWMDIDCGEGKDYTTKNEAVAALKAFCKTTTLPKPFLVDSGRGLHVYWPFDHDVGKAEWLPLAKALKKAAVENELHIDPVCTADAARVLRVPNTLNYKNIENPVGVKILTFGNKHPINLYREALQRYFIEEKPAVLATRELDPLTKMLMGNYESEFAKIARKSLGGTGTGCAQIKHALEESATLYEPLWHAALSIAYRCSDADAAIHKLSRNHPNYDPDETDRKAQGTAGPRTCDWYRNESGNGAACEGCTHKITSPIQLGKTLKTPEPEPPDEPETVEGEEVHEEPVAEHKIPDYPFPYLRGVNGGVYRKDRTPDGEVEEVLVYDYDLYVTRRIHDDQLGECAVMKLHLPRDPVREFALPLKVIQSSDKMRDALSEQGVAFTGMKGLQNIMTYTSSFVKHLQAKMQAEKARTQFGWADGDTKFIVGSREISESGVNHSPPSSTTAELVPYMKPTGTLEAWKEAYGMYKPYESTAQGHIFALLSAFGSPVLKFTGTAGALISLQNVTSGTGKTSLLRLVCSVWGQPNKLLLLAQDTTMAKMQRMGVMNCLPNCFDEMTNTKPEDLSNLVYAISQGRGRNRMMSGSNAERVNNTTWDGLSLCNGNASIVAKLSSHKATAEGELMRVLEYKVALQEIPDGLRKVTLTDTNYGLAGDIYAAWLVTNRDKLPVLLDKARKKINAMMESMVVKERFWLSTLAANYVGGVIAKGLGLHDYDMDLVLQWMCNHALNQRETVKASIMPEGNILGEFVNEHFGALNIMNEDEVDPLTLKPLIKVPYNKLVGRFDARESSLYISTAVFKEYCTKRQVDMEDLLNSKSDDFQFVGRGKHRLGTGNKVCNGMPPVWALKFIISGDILEAVRGNSVAEAAPA